MSSSESESESTSSFPILATALKRKAPPKRPANAKRKGLGEYHRLHQRLSIDDDLYYKYFSMPKFCFEKLRKILEANISKFVTNSGEPISAGERLTLTLRYLATGNTLKKIAGSFRVGYSSVNGIIGEVCKEIWDALEPEYMPLPNKETWDLTAMSYHDVLFFPNCVGSIGGKYVALKCLESSVSIDKASSLVLFTVVDPFHNFLAVDIGNYECNSDRDVFENSDFYKKFLHEKSLLFDKPLPKTKDPVPHVLIGDESFVTRENLISPFPELDTVNDKKKANYNERLRSSLSVVEGAYSLLGQKWRIFLKPIECEPDTAIVVIKASCILHNFIKQKIKILNEFNRKRQPVLAFNSLSPIDKTASTGASVIREKFVDYFDKNKFYY